MDQEKKRFALGVGLVWAPVLLMLGPSLFGAFRGVSQEKATGLAVVAGGFAEALATVGLVAFVVSQVAAIVLLARGIKRDQWGQSMAAVISIACSLVILALMALAMWWLRHVQALEA